MTRHTYGRYSFDSSHEDKRLFPPGGPTKGDVIDYYTRIAATMLPHLKDRPLVMRRCPDGIDDDCFYQKQIGGHFPDWISRVTVSKRGGGQQTLVVASNAASLAYLASQAVVPLHGWLSRRDRLEHPDQLVIDLDPPGNDFAPVRRAARHCKQLLEQLGLNPFLKTTGSTGLHVVVALDRSASYERVRRFARTATGVLAARYPDSLTTEVRKAKRRGRVYLDVARNGYAQTAVAPYSLRALAGAPVATPIDWDELGQKDLHAGRWTIANIFRRLAQREDPWRHMRRRAMSLESAERLLADIGDEDG